MNYKQRAALLIILVAAICGLAIWGVVKFRYRGLTTTADWLEHLPTQDGLVFYADFAAMRSAGVLRNLAGAKVAEEPEYKVFVLKTDFDYSRDLDAVLACFTPQSKFFVVKGRFDWGSLQSYTREQGGNCRNGLCRMNGSTADRKISFFPLRPELMGLAVSPDDSAATEVEPVATKRRTIQVPSAPLWVSIPPAMLRSATALPEGTRMFARSMENTRDITIALEPRDDRFEATLNVECRSTEQAAILADQLTRITTVLREMIEKDKQTPNPRDLSGVLTSGSFSHVGMRVLGSWKLERAFLDGLLNGS
ncbi:MAG: hypothetical protein U0Q18_06365 [Bryobacteraceae bacterium]